MQSVIYYYSQPRSFVLCKHRDFLTYKHITYINTELICLLDLTTKKKNKRELWAFWRICGFIRKRKISFQKAEIVLGSVFQLPVSELLGMFVKSQVCGSIPNLLIQSIFGEVQGLHVKLSPQVILMYTNDWETIYERWSCRCLHIRG